MKLPSASTSGYSNGLSPVKNESPGAYRLPGLHSLRPSAGSHITNPRSEPAVLLTVQPSKRLLPPVTSISSQYISPPVAYGAIEAAASSAKAVLLRRHC